MELMTLDKIAKAIKMTIDAEFDENKHKRDEHGRFTSSSGNTSSESNGDKESDKSRKKHPTQKGDEGFEDLSAEKQTAYYKDEMMKAYKNGEDMYMIDCHDYDTKKRQRVLLSICDMLEDEINSEGRIKQWDIDWQEDEDGNIECIGVDFGRMD